MQNSNINYAKPHYTIGEVADMLDVDQHVVRFWSNKFEEYIKPVITAGNRRNYSPGDISTLISIKNLLYTRGLSIKGVKLLLDEGKDINNTSIASADNTKYSNIITKLEEVNSKIKNFTIIN